MKLANALSADFDPDVRSRGASYYRSGAVRIRRGSDTEVEARVRGSRQYDVELNWDGTTLCMFCDCPYFEGRVPCKHLWATILASDAQDYLSDIVALDPNLVVYEFPDDELDDLGDDDDTYFVFPDRAPSRGGAQPAYRPQPLVFGKKPAYAPQPKVVPPVWRQRLQEVGVIKYPWAETWPAKRELLYLIDVPTSISGGTLYVSLSAREPKLKGGWKKPIVPRLSWPGLARMPQEDREIVGMLAGSAGQSYFSLSTDEIPTGFRLRQPLASTLMPRMTASGRCMLRLTAFDDLSAPVLWDEGEPWRFQLRLTREGGKCAISGCFRRGDEEMPLSVPLLLTDGLVFTKERVARLEQSSAFEWIAALRRVHSIEAPESDAEQMLAALLDHPLAAPLEVPPDLRYEEIKPAPKPCLTIRADKRNQWEPEKLRGDLAFDYDGRRIPEFPAGRGIYDAESRRYLVRDQAAEESAKELLRGLGLENTTPQEGWGLTPKKMPAVARACLDAGWHLEAEGKMFRRPGEMRMEVSSGIDWFELHGEVDYGGATAKLPVLLAALRRGETMVRLDDGTYGLLPEEWLSRFGSLAELGSAESGHMRFRRNQVGLLDALLAAQPEVHCDATFARGREELRTFQGIRTGEQPEGFIGQLRDYQREGVGWMEFLRRFGFGGCLADDMGVGKTAQVLALLESRRVLRAANGNGHDGADSPSAPSLVVVPRSLVFNWKQEAARFTPQLRVLDHTGVSRAVEGFDSYDLILATYGTLRRDAAAFKDLEFDYIVLDEAQAIKNANTVSAKATRLLRGRHRLALSGTPVENHLGELWSIFEFLNPGMLGAASVFKLAGNAARNPSEETRSLLAHALRPFILRRTKEQVARELPQKTEQTIFCDMEHAQRKLYDELRAHYRNSLLQTVAAKGLAKSKIQVLEALLRLRQAACHPGLIDPKRRNDPSAKLEVLTSQLGEVIDEGHKALVFSQFTSMLSIVRKRLDEAGIVYEYLDGSTRNRQQCVERFQNDKNCGLFLISLKAGGLGLNLTAAEYVFLLDPWWNPAVEAQAVDRAHRIGQTRQVFAYRLIARDTVEEKILQLQSSKRDLAAAIINEDSSVLRNLKPEDLELLLS